MKKIELERLLQQRTQELEQRIREMKAAHDAELKSVTESYEKKLHKQQEQQYKHWCGMNAEFLDRYIREKVMPRFEVKTECDYGGYVNVSLLYDKEHLSSDSDSVTIQHNPLDE